MCRCFECIIFTLFLKSFYVTCTLYLQKQYVNDILPFLYFNISDVLTLFNARHISQGNWWTIWWWSVYMFQRNIRNKVTTGVWRILYFMEWMYSYSVYNHMKIDGYMYIRFWLLELHFRLRKNPDTI